MRKFIFRSLVLAGIAAMLSPALAQSRHNARGSDSEGTVLSIAARRTDGVEAPIRLDDLFLYEDGQQQLIRNFTRDPSPSRILLLVDNSQTLAADLDKLREATMEFAYEIYDGDQLFVIAYDDKPEIIQEWTDNAEKLQASLATFRKKGNPHLVDALSVAVREVINPLMPGTRKTAVVVIGDGLDRGSETEFEKVLSHLQDQNIVVYALQLPDRTGGAYRRNQPKAGAVINRLTQETGGMAFPFEDARSAAKAICDELRNNRYLLSYFPVNTSTYKPRRVFVMGGDGIAVRTKTAQPPNVN